MDNARRTMAGGAIPVQCSPLAALVAAALMALALAGCGAAASDGRALQHAQPESVAQGSRPPGYIFETLPQLVVSADVVIVGEVQRTSPGDPAILHWKPGQPIPADAGLWRDVTVTVEEQLYGPPVSDSVVAKQLGFAPRYGEDGYTAEDYAKGDLVGYEMSEQPWLYPGDRVVLLLENLEGGAGAGYKILIAGEWVIEPAGTVTVYAEDPALVPISGVPWPAVRQQLVDAVRRANSGKIEPLNPGDRPDAAAG